MSTTILPHFLRLVLDKAEAILKLYVTKKAFNHLLAIGALIQVPIGRGQYRVRALLANRNEVTQVVTRLVGFIHVLEIHTNLFFPAWLHPVDLKCFAASNKAIVTVQS